MSIQDQAHRRWLEIMGEFQPRIERRRGILGDGTGEVRVDGRPDLVYMRPNADSTTIWKVFNDTVDDINNWPVIAEKHPDSRYWRVIETDREMLLQRGDGWSGVKTISTHHETHEWPTHEPGPDPVSVFPRAILPLRTEATIPSYSLNVNIRPLIYTYNGVEKRYLGETLSLSSYVPTTGIRLVTTYLDQRLNRAYTIAGPAVAYNAEADPPAPRLPWYALPSSSIILRQGQTYVTESDIHVPYSLIPEVGLTHRLQAQRDPTSSDDYTKGFSEGSLWINRDSGDVFTCTNPALGAAVWSSGGGGGTDGVWPLAGVVTNSSTGTTYDSITAFSDGVNSLGSSQQLLVGNGSYTSNNESPATSARILGSGIETTTIETSSGAALLNMTGAAVVESLKLRSSTGGTTDKGITFSGGVTSYIRDVMVDMLGNATTAIAYEISGANLNMYHCDTDSLSEAATNIAIQTDTSGTTNIFGGRFIADVVVGASTTVNFYGPTISGTITVNGTATGWYYQPDTDEIMVFVSNVATAIGGGVWPQGGKLTNTADGSSFTTIASLISDLAANEQGLIGEGSFACENQTVGSNEHLKGSGQDVSELTNSTQSTSLIGAGGNTFQDFTINNTLTTGATCFRADGAGVVCRGIKANATATSSGAVGFYVFGGSSTLDLYNCHAVCGGGSGTDVALQAVSSGAVMNVYGGYFDGDVDANTGTTVNLYGPTITGDVDSGAGTVTGHYFDSNGILHRLISGTATDMSTRLREADDGGNALTADNSGDLTAANNLTVDTGYIESRQTLTQRNTNVADDTAFSVPVMAVGNRFFFVVNSNGGSYFFGVCTYNGITAIANSGFSVVAGGGTLTGTTGPDTTINVRDNNGQLYVENRVGGVQNIGVFVFGTD